MAPRLVKAAAGASARAGRDRPYPPGPPKSGFPLGGSFQEEIDIDVDVDSFQVPKVWVAVKELNSSCHNMDIYQMIWLLDYGNLPQEGTIHGFPLKGSFEGDVSTHVDVEIDSFQVPQRTWTPKVCSITWKAKEPKIISHYTPKEPIID